MPAGTQASGQEGSHSAQGRGEAFCFGVESEGRREKSSGELGEEAKRESSQPKPVGAFTEGLQGLMRLVTVSLHRSDVTPSISHEKSSERIAVLTSRSFWCLSHMPGPLGSQPAL